MTLALVPLLALLSSQVAAAPSPEWQQRYQQAREDLQQGRFAAAAAALEELARTAPDPADGKAAAAQAELARFWASGNFRLLAPSQPGTPPLQLLPDRRTTDELAVLYTGAVLYGVGSGVVLAVFTEPDSPAGGILPALGLAAASAGLVAYLDHNVQLRYGVPQSIVSGLLIGFEEGLAWTLWRQASADSGHQWDEDVIAGILWGTSTAGAIAGGVLGTRFGTTPGRASFVGSAALWSGVVAGLGAAAITGDDGDRDDNALLSAALALNVGAIGGAVAALRVSPSIARVRFLDLGGIAGGLLAGGLYWAFAGNDDVEERALLATLAGGSTAGLLAAWWLTSGLPPELPRGEEQARIVPLLMPTAHGALLGVGGAL